MYICADRTPASLFFPLSFLISFVFCLQAAEKVIHELKTKKTLEYARHGQAPCIMCIESYFKTIIYIYLFIYIYFKHTHINI